MKFLAAKNFSPASRTKIDIIVIHDMEAPEAGNTAERVAQWFAGVYTTAPRASCHYCIDNDSIVQCVLEKDIAWHAPGAQGNSIGIEHAGFARQTAAEWADAYSTAMLRLSAGLVAQLCARYSIPVAFLDGPALLRGERGITGHCYVNDAYKKSTHWDPGPHFPWASYLQTVRDLLPGHAAPVSRLAKIQARLISLGYQLGPSGADGKIGPWTLKAIKAFQSAHPPLVVDGIVGPKTWAALMPGEAYA